MDRRRFLSTTFAAAAGGALAGRLSAWTDDLRAFALPADENLQFQTDDAKLATTYQLALAALTVKVNWPGLRRGPGLRLDNSMRQIAVCGLKAQRSRERRAAVFSAM